MRELVYIVESAGANDFFYKFKLNWHAHEFIKGKSNVKMRQLRTLPLALDIRQFSLLTLHYFAFLAK